MIENHYPKMTLSEMLRRLCSKSLLNIHQGKLNRCLDLCQKKAKNFYDFEKFQDKRFYGNIERAFGTLILNMLGGAVNDYANGVKMYGPDLLPVHTYGDCKTGFTIELEFIVVVECLNINQDYSNLKKALVVACPNGWEIE